jgi:FkbM family methyltransferase
MHRRDFLTGAVAGAATAGLLGVVGKIRADRTAASRPPASAVMPATPVMPPAEAVAKAASQYKGRTSYAQDGEDLMLYSLLYNVLKLQKPSYLDIGAGDPVQGNNTYAFYGSGSRGVLVEPNPTLVDALRRVRPADVVVNAGVGVSDVALADYYVIRDQWPLNTFSPEDVAALRRRSKEDPVEKVIKMPLIQINRLIKDHFDKAPDLLSIDIEGMDLDVLKSLDFHAYRPAAICAETKNPSQSHDSTPIAKLLRSKNYCACAGSLYNTIFVDLARISAS